MMPLLLLLLLHESLAEQVCLNISNYGISVTGSHIKFIDTLNSRTQFPRNHCIFSCTLRGKAWFNGTSDCLEVDLKHNNTGFIYNFQEHQICICYKCISSSILPLMHSLNHIKSNLVTLFSIKDSCVELFQNNHEVRRAFINLERGVIHAFINDTKIVAGSSKTYSLKQFSLNVFNIDKAYLNSTANSTIQLLLEDHSFFSKIWLPVDALKNIPDEKRIVGLVSYNHHSHFQFHQEDITSMVLRIELLGERRLSNLITPIKMIFRVSRDTATLGNQSQLLCHYFDEHSNDISFSEQFWKTDGCETLNITQQDKQDIVCHCDHTTPFAVLLIRDQIPAAHWKILSYISYVGCGLSAFFTALSLMIYIFNRNHKLDYSISIHVSLSGALFLLNSTFLLTEWGATVELEWVCEFVAAFMHYSLLCCFTWMAIEALHLYLLLIKVFNTYYKHYLLKLSLAGWGIPGVIVAITVGMKNFKQFYGVTKMTLSDTNQTSSICWITDDSYFYSMNLLYFILIFIFNFGILMTVASSICKMKNLIKTNLRLGAENRGKSWGDREKFSASCQSVLTLLGLTCLMGITWGLAFLGSGYVSYPILYLFCILNSTQGFFIFLWICLSAKKQRKRAKEDRLSSAPVRTLGTKSE